MLSDVFYVTVFISIIFVRSMILHIFTRQRLLFTASYRLEMLYYITLIYLIMSIGIIKMSNDFSKCLLNCFFIFRFNSASFSITTSKHFSSNAVFQNSWTSSCQHKLPTSYTSLEFSTTNSTLKVKTLQSKMLPITSNKKTITIRSRMEKYNISLRMANFWMNLQKNRKRINKVIHRVYIFGSCKGKHLHYLSLSGWKK